MFTTNKISKMSWIGVALSLGIGEIMFWSETFINKRQFTSTGQTHTSQSFWNNELWSLGKLRWFSFGKSLWRNFVLFLQSERTQVTLQLSPLYENVKYWFYTKLTRKITSNLFFMYSNCQCTIYIHMKVITPKSSLSNEQCTM